MQQEAEIIAMYEAFTYAFGSDEDSFIGIEEAANPTNLEFKSFREFRQYVEKLHPTAHLYTEKEMDDLDFPSTVCIAYCTMDEEIIFIILT
jgi:hypothetical protein